MSSHTINKPGVIPPVPTLFDSEGNFDRNRMSTLIDYLISKGVHAMLFLGTIGEFSQMDVSQRMQIAEFCITHTRNRVPVWIGTGSNSTLEAIQLTKHAEQNGADGVIIINPYYIKLGEKTLFQHYADILEQSGLPVFLYNFPALTGQDLSPEFVRSLAARYPQVVGIKDTVDQLSHIREMIQQVKEVRPDFAVYAGFDEYLLATLAAGGDGAIAASASFAPELMLGVYNGFRNGDLAGMLAFHHRLLSIPKIYPLVSPFIKAVKEAIQLTAVPISTYCLAPAAPWEEDKALHLREILTEANLAVRRSAIE
ncbi:MAG: dihydrodipicolinate synthase family protein [Gorillibacterium sp.]|nr:dihydrodipicolinate synthase family protein [Gorillibacterium sp.]